MSAGDKTQAQAESQAEAQAQEASILDQAVKATTATKRDRAQELLKTLTEEALKGTVSYDKSVTRTINAGIAAIDQAVSKQLAAIMHRSEFQKLEGSWRGLNYLVMNTETSKTLKLRMMQLSKKELGKDLETAVEFDQSQMFKKLYETEYGMPGGEPYGALIGDYEFTNHPDDMSMLEGIAGVAASSHCPFISAASPELFGMKSFTELSKPRDLEKIFTNVEYTQWSSFRNSDDSRYVVLTMPRALSRLPYGQNTKPIDEFDFEEVELGRDGKAKPVPHDHYAWMNAAHVLGARLTDCFAKFGWCTRIRGAESGGKVEGLPAHIFKTDDGDTDLKCPTELAITDRREAELSKLGFLPLCHYKNTDYAVFFGAQSTQQPKKYDRANATANAAISARLPYIMASSRIAHYLKVIARDKIGGFMERSDCQQWLERWIANYVSADPKPSEKMKAKYPLAEAKISVEEIPGSPGAYRAIAWLRPWLQLEALTASLRLVAKLPENVK